MNGISYTISGTPEFENLKSKLLTKTNGITYALEPICQGKIGDQFVEDSINKAHYLFANYYNNYVIGFASVLYYSDNTTRTYLYIDLICNAPPNISLNLRSSVNINRKGARDMIENIENLGKQLNCSYIKLSAIDAVIPYYFRLGFNFETIYNNNGQEINQYLQNKASDLIKNLRSGQLNDDKDAQEQAMIKIIQRFYPGYLSEKSQKTISEIGRDRTGPSRDTGIPMIKILTYPHNDVWDNPLHGGKKTKKRRKSVPKKYIPKFLTNKDTHKQRDMLKKSRKMYKQGKYYTRKNVKSFKSIKSNHIINAKKIYKVDKIYPNKQLSNKTGCSVDALNKIVKKGEGAYYSSGSRPNQTPKSWGYARLASAITGGKSAAVDYNILKKGCGSKSKALQLAKKAKNKYGHGRRKTPQVNI